MRSPIRPGRPPSRRAILRWIVFGVCCGAIAASADETALDRYVAKPDPNYAFTHHHTIQYPGVTSFLLRMTSQQWRSPAEVDRSIWEHDIRIAVPWGARFNQSRTAILLIEGGSNRDSLPMDPEPVLWLAALVTGTPIVWLQQVPNQPLYFADEVNHRRSEDAILAYSLDKFLVTGDGEWPVHVAMTKAAVRAMDTAQDFLDTKLLFIDDFIVMGGSKRGWTSMLTAAVDPRVRAVMAASIDVFNFDVQVRRHWESYGFYAPAIQDYTAFDLFCRADTPRGQDLLNIIDPYEYRERLTMPKLLLNSAGDQFFLPDSSRFYYHDLPGPKRMAYSFNTDHSQVSVSALFGALAYFKALINDVPRAPYAWVILPGGAIIVKTFEPAARVRVWQATNPEARDFRLESLGPAWRSQTLEPIGDGLYLAYRPPPEKGWRAFCVELWFGPNTVGGYERYTTDVSIVPDVLPFAGEHCVDR